jgi:hypothetical protein
MVLYTVLVLALLAVILPNFMKARTTMAENACFVSQRVVLQAREAYLNRHRLKPTDPIYVTNLVNESFLKTMPLCPATGAYGPVLTEQGLLNCSYAEHDFAHFTNDLAARRLYPKFERYLNHPGTLPTR